MGASDLSNRRLAVEAAALGVGYASGLCWASTALVGSFGGAPLASPYWPDLPWTHLLSWPSEGTVRVLALAICAVSVAATRYLRSAGRDGQGEVLGHGRVWQVEQPAPDPDLETRLTRRVDPG
jgi:hypothetical protein